MRSGAGTCRAGTAWPSQQRAAAGAGLCCSAAARRSRCLRVGGGAGVACASAHRDLTADILENVASLALRARLKECRSVKTSVSCDAWSLLAGRVNGVKIVGEGWRSPLNLTAQLLEATVGEATLDPGAVLLKQQIALTNRPVGTAHVVFTAPDFGNFLCHPLMTAAAQACVQGHAFVFEAPSVRIIAPSRAAPAGVIEFAGTWRGDGQRYQVSLLPVPGGAALGALGRGVQAHAVPLSIGARASSASIVEDSLTKFFNTLTLDLQGAELSFMSLTVIPGLGFAGGLADLNLRLELKRFPPLNVALHRSPSPAKMTASKRIVNAKSARVFNKRGVAEPEKKQKGKMPVGPVMLGFFLFVVVGSAVLQIIRTATTGNPDL
ncbi:Serp2 [Scenedesmus sp. PABB004]|nr:Serp2 [Scenedesmus sp. PABB004]